MAAVFQRAVVSSEAVANGIDESDSQLSPNGELENIARFGCQGVFAHHTTCPHWLIAELDVHS